jgi:hypothetical protein
MLRCFKSSINVFADIERLRFHKRRQKSEVYLVARVLPFSELNKQSTLGSEGFTFSDLSSCLTLGSESFAFSDLKKKVL